MNPPDPYLRLDDQVTQRQEYRFTLDLMLTALIITLLIAAFWKQEYIFIKKTRLTEVLSIMSVERINVIEHHAYMGEWLDITEPNKEVYTYSSPLTKLGSIQQGAIHMQVLNRQSNATQTSPALWSIRPAIAADDAPTVLWVCGSRLPPAGFRAFGTDMTTIPPEINFRFCQQH